MIMVLSEGQESYLVEQSFGFPDAFADLGALTHFSGETLMPLSTDIYTLISLIIKTS
jgi:hypothetical protein